MSDRGGLPSADCLTGDVLRDYGLGRLASDTVQTIADHISTCPRCESVLLALRSDDDPLVVMLRECVAEAPLAREPVAPPHSGTATWRLPPPKPRGVTPAHDQPTRFALSPEPVPVVIGRYRILEPLGAGGMGVVYKAADSRLNRVVAIKTLRHGFYAGPESLVRFGTEGEAGALLDCPNIVRVLDAGDTEAGPYLVMEFLPGGSLARKLARGPLPACDAAELVRTLALAVEHAHEHGVLHRDLKPGNILLDADGTPKVSDFGLARLIEDGSGVTQSLDLMGTPAYMAPEQAGGRTKEFGPATDVYGLGAILYECLTGQAPFRGTKDEVVRKVRDADPVSPIRYQAECGNLAAVCLKCLAKRPADRYPSAQALADDLTRWLNGEPTIARLPGLLKRGWRAARKRPGLIVAVLLSLVAALAFAAVHHYGDPERARARIEDNLA